MPNLVILHPRAFAGENHGVFVQHVTTLATLLEGRGWAVSSTDLFDPHLAQVVAAADVVVVQMLSSPEVEALVYNRRAHGRPTIFEITDNFLGIGRWLEDGHSLSSPLTRARLLHHAHLCDALQVYAPGLAQLFGAVNHRVLRFDPYVPIPDRLPSKGTGFVVGWGGTTSHAGDLAALAPTVTAFCARHPHVTFAYMGDRALFEEHFGSIDPAQTSVRPFGTHAEYLDFVAGLNVGLGPLAPTPFNAGRTDTRFGTYAALGVAAVLQDGVVYGRHRDLARVFRDAVELEAILEDLFVRRLEVAALAARAHAWARAERGDDVLAKQRDSAYRSLLADASRVATDAPSNADADGESARLRSHLSAATGLPPGEALLECEQILAEHPTYEQARLLAARSLVRLGRDEEALQFIDSIPPSFLYADLFVELQVRCARRLRRADADRLLTRIASPVRRAQLAEHGSVLARSQAVLEHQPYDHFALSSTIRCLLHADPAAEELDDLFERAALVAPEDVPHDRRPARLATFLPS